MEALLKASEAAALMGVSARWVQVMAKKGGYSNVRVQANSRGRDIYLIPLSSLPDAAQQKYFAEHAPAALTAVAPAKAKKADRPAACKPLEAYTAEERGEIGYWITTVDRWQTYRNKAGTKKAECDEKFVLLCRMEEPDRQISVETLYRKWAAIREGDYGALVDMRGKARKGMSKMPEAIERVFLSLFLDERQLPVPRCIALTEEWAQQNMPEAMPLPRYHTFYRKAKAVPYPVMVLCRMGEKKYYDLCSPYIRREYESINANDFWVGDTHTLDVESMGPDGTLHRLYLSAWLDARSGIFTGWYVTDGPGSQATLNALRKGILKFGIGAVVDCSRGELIRIAPAPSKASGMITYDRKLQDGSKVTLNPLITAVAVTAHRYLPGESTEELYRDTLDPGTYRVTFNAPAVVGSLTVTGAELTESGVNLCTLTVAEAGEVCVTGRKYADSTVVLKRTAANLPPNVQDNELTVTDATLVDPSRAEAVAVRVLEHYAQRYEQNFSMVAGDEKLADRLIIQSFGGEMVRGMLTKLEFDLTGGFLADAKVIGRRLTSNAAAYAGEIRAGERNLI